jgi:hypothetical protein
MPWKGFAAGLAVGVGVCVAWAVYKPKSKVADDETVVFSDKQFYDNIETIGRIDNFLKITGTLRANGDPDGPGYKNNTMTIQCMREQNRCEVASVRQIGANLVDDIDVGDWDITAWNNGEVVAQDVGLCSTTTLTIGRESHEIGYVTVPTNPTSPACLKSGNAVHKWTIGRSLGWERMDPTNAAKVKSPN